MQTIKKIAIIPARGGSKRIPRKNIKNFLGKPIIVYSIETALKSGLFDEIMVSTDDTEIAEIAQKHGAKVPFMRSEKNANDYATTADVLKEVLQNYRQLQQKNFEYACCIYPTAPFVSTELLQESFDLLNNNSFDTVFPVMAYSYPIQRALKIHEGKMQLFQPEHLNTRSQDLEKAYHDAGQFYWLQVDKFQKSGKLWTDNTGVIVIDESQVQDIDTQEDWQLAELKYKILHGIS